MVRKRFSGRDIVKVLTSHNYTIVGREGSHVRLRWEPPCDHEADARVVTVPVGHEISGHTLRSIADQCGAEEVDAWCEWIDRHS